MNVSAHFWRSSIVVGRDDLMYTSKALLGLIVGLDTFYHVLSPLILMALQNGSTICIAKDCR